MLHLRGWRLEGRLAAPSSAQASRSCCHSNCSLRKAQRGSPVRRRGTASARGQVGDLQVTVPLRAHRSRVRHDPDCHHAIVYQFWLVRGGGNGGWGRAKPIVPGGASKLALRVSTLSNVVRNAAITAIAKAVAKIANTVRWVIGPPTPPDRADRLAKVPTPWGQFFEVASFDLSRAYAPLPREPTNWSKKS
jgi:hypothetical protein